MVSIPLELKIERERSAPARRDLGLVQAALGGSPKAYEELMRHYHQSVYHLALKMVSDRAEAEDVTMETFAKAFRHLGRYTPDFAFSTWLFRIATNHAIDFLRRRRVTTLPLYASGHLGEGTQVLVDVRDDDPDPQEQFIRQQRRERVQWAVEQLPPKFTEMVRLRYFEELTYEEVAIQLRLPLGSVKAYLNRARTLLLALLENSQPEL